MNTQREKRLVNTRSNNIKISAETPSDYQAVANINQQAFGQINEALLIEKIRESDRYIPELSLDISSKCGNRE